mmetsp:Transcript_26169/g.55211  ORF Transcript_26169/g.55211 Transcript_26169/m.55211 type:complete len:235 (+) Transcript_26169:1681-2385(+)
MVENSGCVNDLPAQVLVVGVTHEERLGGKGVGLHVNVGPCDFVHEGTLSNIGQTTHQQSPRIRIQCGQSRHVLPHLLQITQTRLLPLQNGTHPTQRRPLQTLASVERIAVFDHTDHIPGHGVDELLGRVDLSEGELVVIAIVERVAEVGVEGMDVGQAGKVGEHGREAVGDGLLGEFDFAHVKVANPRNLVSGMDHRRRPSLRPRQDDVHEIVRAWHGCHFFKVVDRHVDDVDE